MHKQGHYGVSLLLTAPFVAVFLLAELYLFAAVFGIITVKWCSLPDIDIPLQNYDTLSFRTVDLGHWIWIPILSKTGTIMRFHGRFIKRVPRHYSGKTIGHRGITHTLWFGMALGVGLVGVTASIIGTALLLDEFYQTPFIESAQMLINGPLLGILPVVFLAGVCSVTFHCVGDTFTPTGIHFLTPRTDYGFSMNQFYANNTVANRSALPFGVLGISYALFVGFAAHTQPWYYLLGGFVALFIIGIPIWLFAIRTPVGRWVYTIYDFFR